MEQLVTGATRDSVTITLGTPGGQRELPLMHKGIIIRNISRIENNYQKINKLINHFKKYIAVASRFLYIDQS